jgi:5,5'-dehydrodivanillate O-demethylase oxygenase subunit
MQTEIAPPSHAAEDFRDFGHVGPGTLAGRYLRTFWHPVFLGKDLPVGKAIPLRVLGEDFTLYRGETGTPHIVGFRCAHRQNQLSIGWVEDDNIRCFYHGWMYDGSGQCVQQPGEFHPFCDRIKIPGYPTEEYLGMIWAYFGEGEPPPMPRYPDLEDGGVRRLGTYVRECNFFQNLENGPDHVHIFFTHYARAGTGRADSPVTEHSLAGYTEWRRRGGREGFLEYLPRISTQETDWGLEITYTYEFGKYTSGISMPLLDRRGESWAWRVPIDDETHRTINLTQDISKLLGHAPRSGQPPRKPWNGDPRSPQEIIAAIMRGEVHIDDYFDHPQAGTMQDVIAQVGQGRLTDRSKEHLGMSDAGLVGLRQLWSREMRKLAEGQPLKQWALSPSMTGHEGLAQD